MREFTRKERLVIEKAWLALEYCASSTTSLGIELADSLKYETGSRTAGRPRIWAKALIVDSYMEGRYGKKGEGCSTEERRRWLADAVGVSRGVRFGYLLACSGRTWRNEMEEHVALIDKARAAVAVYNAVCARATP